MPEYLRSFAVISVLMGIAYLFSRQLFAKSIEPKFVGQLFGLGYAVTAIMFFTQNMALSLGGLAFVSLLTARRFTYPLAIFVFLLLVLPGYSIQVPGFGITNYLLNLNAWRVLSITVLLPAALHLAANAALPRPGKLLADNIVIIYVSYSSLLAYLHYDTLTGGLRHLTTAALDIALVYFVASRSLMLKEGVRHVMVALVAGAVFLALVGAFEFFRKWILYYEIQKLLSGAPVILGYLRRGETLRAVATTGQPIVLGFVMMVALLSTIYVQRLVPSRAKRYTLWLILSLGLLSAMSRGPWVGCAVGVIVAAAMNGNPIKSLIKMLTAFFVVAVVLMGLPGGETVISYLPWVGHVDESNITFRQLLWEQAWGVIMKSPWIGSIDFESASEFDSLRTGSGFIDIVNSYLGEALEKGLIGLALYVLLIIVSIFSNLKLLVGNKMGFSESATYGRALLGCVIAVAVTIWTVSSINQIQAIVVLLIGACVASSQLKEAKC